MRSSGPVSTCAFGRVHPLDVLQRHRLDDVHLARQERGDAGRVGADRREDDLGQVVLRLAHQAAFGLNTVFTPGWWLSILKGPVPLVLSDA